MMMFYIAFCMYFHLYAHYYFTRFLVFTLMKLTGGVHSWFQRRDAAFPFVCLFYVKSVLIGKGRTDFIG